MKPTPAKNYSQPPPRPVLTRDTDDKPEPEVKTTEPQASVKATTPEELRNKAWKEGLAKAQANKPTLFEVFGFNRSKRT